MLPSPPAADDRPGVEAAPVVAARAGSSRVADVGELDRDPAGGRVLDGVLHRLDAAEVEGGLDVGGLPADPAVERPSTGTLLVPTTSRTAAATPSSVSVRG